MTRDKSRSPGSAPIFPPFVRKLVDLLAAAGLFFTDLKESVQEHLDRILRRVEYLFIVYLWISIGALLLVLGVFDLLIDTAGVPRGVVFSIGGALIALVAVVFLQTAKIKKNKR